MILSRRSIFAGCSIGVAIVSPACQEKPKDKNPMGMSFRDTWGPRTPVVKDEKGNAPVAKGKPTLAYMIEFPCTVRVIDQGTSKVVATAPARQGDIVAIEASTGIRIGDKKYLAGPLEPTTVYGIYCERSK